MGNNSTWCSGRDKEKPVKTLTLFQVIDINMQAIKKMKSLEKKDANITEFINRKGKIDIQRRDEVLTDETIGAIQRYTYEWMFIQYEKEWREVFDFNSLIKKGDEVDDYNHVILYFNVNRDQQNMKSLEEILSAHNVKLADYRSSETYWYPKSNNDFEREVTEVLWTQFAFSDRNDPIVMAKDDVVKAINYQMETAKEHGHVIIEMKKKVPDNEKAHKVIGHYLVKQNWKEHKIHPGDYSLGLIHKALVEDKDVLKHLKQWNDLIFSKRKH
jgi:hypothetical protein